MKIVIEISHGLFKKRASCFKVVFLKHVFTGPLWVVPLCGPTVLLISIQKMIQNSRVYPIYIILIKKYFDEINLFKISKKKIVDFYFFAVFYRIHAGIISINTEIEIMVKNLIFDQKFKTFPKIEIFGQNLKLWPTVAVLTKKNFN